MDGLTKLQKLADANEKIAYALRWSVPTHASMAKDTLFFSDQSREEIERARDLLNAILVTDQHGDYFPVSPFTTHS